MRTAAEGWGGGGGGANIAAMDKDPTVSVLWKGTKRRQISTGFGWCQTWYFRKSTPLLSTRAYSNILT